MKKACLSGSSSQSDGSSLITITVGHLFLKSINVFDVKEQFEKDGTTFEIHAAGNFLVGKQTMVKQNERVL